MLLLFPSASPTKRSSNRIEERKRMNFASLSSSHTRSEIVILSLFLSFATKTTPLFLCGRSFCSLVGVFVRRVCATLSLSLMCGYTLEKFRSFPNIVSLLGDSLSVSFCPSAEKEYERHMAIQTDLRVRNTDLHSPNLSKTYRLI